jgi:hypothetical protein
MGLSHTADHALDRQLAQPVDRVDDVQIALEPGAVEVNRDMARQDIARGYGSWQETTLSTAERERLVAAPYQCGAGYDCHSTLRQRRTNNERLGLKGRARRGNHRISCRLWYVLKSSHGRSSVPTPQRMPRHLPTAAMFCSIRFNTTQAGWIEIAPTS